MINRGFVFKLYPDAQTERAFREYAGVCRLVYNLALEQRVTWGRRERFGYVRQAGELTDLRKAFDFIGAVHVTPEQQALRDLDRAFQNFFAGRAGFPKPRRRGRDDSFRFQGREIKTDRLNAKWSRVRLPKIGWAKFRHTRDIVGKICNATVHRSALGWHIAFSCAIEHEAAVSDLPSVGIDRGVAVAVATSDGDLHRMPESLKNLDRLHRKAQRVISRRKRGSIRWRKAQARAARLKARGARVRKHFNHVLTTQLTECYGTIVLENLKTCNMMRSAKGTIDDPGRNVKQKSGLNRSIANQAWFQFEALLSYKLAECGGYMVKVDPAFTSQTCSACGCIDKQSRDSQALFRCVHCGHEENADVNAAKEILRRNTSSMRMEDAGYGAYEVRRIQEAS